MSYLAPIINPNPTATGLDVPIESIRQALATLTWNQRSYGRAFSFTEERDGKKINVPKAYTSKGEYQNVLPNDMYEAQSFIVVSGPERYIDYSTFGASNRRATINVIFWGNLKKVNASKDYIYTQELINDAVIALKTVSSVTEIIEIVDDNSSAGYFGNSDVFFGFTLPDDSQYYMYPYFAFKITCTIVYPEPC